jgi:hypothetical protein
MAGGSRSAYGQARIMMWNNAYIVIDNAAQLVVDNPSDNAISFNATGANIVSESENDLIRWNIGPITGSYIIPWTNANNVKIPLEVFVSPAGTGPGHFLFSTHSDNNAVNNWDNFDYRPSDVTNMGGPGIANNSANVIDRFWRIEHTGYATAPQALINFGYDDTERTNPGNTIPAGSMFAQEFDAAQGWQGEWYTPGTGSDLYPTTIVAAANASANPFFKSWTLSVVTVPLPVAGLVFEAEKAGEKVQLRWEMEEVEGVQSFVVENSSDGLSFSDLERQPALPGTLAYGAIDHSPFDGMNHYRLRILDADGAVQFSEIKTILMQNSGVNVFPNPVEGDVLQIEFSGLEGEEVKIQLVDMAGRILKSLDVKVDSALELVKTDISEAYAAGIYILEIRSAKGILHREKVIVR